MTNLSQKFVEPTKVCKICFKEIKDNTEFKAYLGFVAFFTVAVSITLISVYGNFFKALRYGAFQVLSLISTTGFATADFMNWPATTQFFLFILFFIGGCSGSTSGGFKVVRWVILGKQLHNEILKSNKIKVFWKKFLYLQPVLRNALNARVAEW